MKRNQHNRTRKNPEDYFRYTRSRMTFRRDSYYDILELITQLPPAKLPDVNVVPSVEEKLMVLTEVYPTIYRFSVIQSVLHIGILTDEDGALIDTCYQYLIDVHYSSDNY